MLEKTFDPKTAEPRLYEAWEQSGAFAPTDDPNAEPFSIVIPPPNVTGSLHIGHALNNTLQDVLIRFERMRGKAALWLPGTDHAGIATQNIVERQLAEAGNISRRDMGREAFVEKIWEWKAKSGGTIVNQLRRLGASCDWSRERFTLDEGLSDAVRKVFVQLHMEGLIYRDKRLVNWDPHFQTAISDIEVEQREVDGAYWHFAYPLEDGSGEIVVATTRPETMLGDTAVAVHPDDERYKHLVGKAVRLPIVNRPIPIVADEYPDPEKGSGAVKITPAHDFNDFQVGKRHNLPVINVFDDYARINENAPEAYRGLDRFAARKKVVEEFEALGLLREIEKTRHVVPHGDRSGVVVEPYLTDQWYVDAKTLAGPAIKAVEEGRTVFEPRNWDKTYFEWMRNIQPWCISRQLWWGHRIPAWYGPDGKAFVAETEEEAKAAAREHYGRDEALKQDEDVLDTWFSSGLWPFSTMGWPEKTSDLARFYPTHTLITGFDIIFFWVARMMMMQFAVVGQKPFDTVYVHALVRDEKGKKMSKSLGNVLDPLDLIDEYGADAVRFTVTAMAAMGRDLRLSSDRIAGYRNFGTKLWNAMRFAEMNEVYVSGKGPTEVRHLSDTSQTVNKWIIGETAKTRETVDAALDAFRFNDAANALYSFVWGKVCDWYVEFSKPLLFSEDAAIVEETRATMGWVLDQCLIMMHPIMPFITEELWQTTAKRDNMLVHAEWPTYQAADLVDENADREMNWVIGLIDAIRSARAQVHVPAGLKIPMLQLEMDAAGKAAWANNESLIMRLARVDSLSEIKEVPKGAITIPVEGGTFCLPLQGIIDVAEERARLVKTLGKLDKELGGLRGRLNNPKFVASAPDEVVEETRQALAIKEEEAEKLKAAEARLAELG